jgi:tetratricopeptide (TPR) repeat protein
MRGFFVSIIGFLCLGAGLANAASVALLRDATITTAITPVGPVAVKQSPVNPPNDVHLIVLADTLASDDLARIRHEIPQAFTASFLAAHSLHLIIVSGTNGQVSDSLSSSSQLQLALRQIPDALAASAPSAMAVVSTLGGVASSLPGKWSQAVIIGRVPAIATDENWVMAWLGDIYRKQRIRVSFWSLDGSAPGWTQDMAASSLGVVSTSALSALMPTLNDESLLYEATWHSLLSKGGWPYRAELRTGSGQAVVSFVTVRAAPDFLLPLGDYLAARASLAASVPPDEASARKVLELNPSDVDGLQRLAAILQQQRKPKESAALWRNLTDVNPGDAGAWAALGETLYAADALDDAARALDQASELGYKSTTMIEIRAKIYLRGKDAAKAVSMIEAALADKKLAGDKASQSLWLLRADCGHQLQRWPLEADSLEHAGAVAPLPLERSSRLISGYLAANDVQHALPHLRAVTAQLPRQAPILAEYADYWEQAHEPISAEPLWKSAVEIDAKYEPAYLGLTRHYAEAHRVEEALHTTDAGLTAMPSSLRLALAKERALESMGDIYAARRWLKDRTATGADPELLKRRAFLEDAYGSQAAELYAAQLNSMVHNEAPQIEVVELCRRGLIVSLRDQRADMAEMFAAKLASAGDVTGQQLLQARKADASASFELLGGADALSFLVFGADTATRPQRILIDFSRMLSSTAPDPHDSTANRQWTAMSARIHEYFKILSELTPLGEKKNGEIEITLALKTKQDKQRTEKVFSILGLKLKSKKEVLAVKAAEGKSEAKKQDTLAALAVDDAEIQETLANGKAYHLKIRLDRVPVFPSLEFWQNFSSENQHYPGGIAETMVADVRMARMFYALHSMDRSTARLLVQSTSIKNLAERYSLPLSYYSAALAVRGGAAEVPGGTKAASAWQNLTGATPANAFPFFQALLNKDEGRMIAFFYSLSQLDYPHQQFFTRSPERLKRFYDLFRESADMKRGGEHRIGRGSFVEFMREVPLNEDLTVDFPGSPEVWMVAKGRKATISEVAKLNRKLKRAVAPDAEDEILVRLATSGYTTWEGEQSELANFITTVHIDAERSEPLSPDAALLLAQGYGQYKGLYGYFAGLGNLEAADYQKLFSLAERFGTMDINTANLRLGELHAFLALIAYLHERGTVSEQKLLAIYRGGLDRYIAASTPAAWTTATLAIVDDLGQLASPGTKSRDVALEALLDGDHASPRRRKAFATVLDVQKAPSLDALFSICSDAAKISQPGSLDDIQRQLGTLPVLPIPKAWRLHGEQKKWLDSFDSAPANTIVLKTREKQGKKKPNAAEIEKLATDLTGSLEPWVELAVVSRIYARYLDPSDLIVSEDPMLVRKHEFTELDNRTGHKELFTHSALSVASTGEGSYFSGGLAEFGMAAGEARAAGNHVSALGEAFATAMFASVRGTDWSGITPAALQSFGATVRLAREWIVQSALAPNLRQTLEQNTLGLLSLNRRQALLDGLEQHDWQSVWQSVSISDLYFLGQSLLETHADAQTTAAFWQKPAVHAMRQVAAQQKDLDALGSIAPALNGCTQPRLRRYAPYEDYERYFIPERMAQRTAELKLYLAWVADNHAWKPEVLDDASSVAVEKLLRSIHMRDQYDWSAIIEACERLASSGEEVFLAER